MKQGSNNRRSRSRGGGKRHSGGGGRNNFESNGPDVKIRGSAQQVQEKYLNLARDASSSGDWVSAEAYFQYAEHYFRIANPDGNANPGKAQGQGQKQGQGGRDQGVREQSGRDQGGRNAKKQEPQEAPAPATDGSPEGEAEVIDTSPAALAAAVSQRETAQDEAPKPARPAPEPAAATEPEKAAS